jgi:hypothetical protein
VRLDGPYVDHETAEAHVEPHHQAGVSAQR